MENTISQSIAEIVCHALLGINEIFGTNTDYVIDPEEYMADNFGYTLAYGMDGPKGDGYPNPL